MREITVTVEPERQVSVPIWDQPDQSAEVLDNALHTWLSPPTVKTSTRCPVRWTDVTGEPAPPMDATPPLMGIHPAQPVVSFHQLVMARSSSVTANASTRATAVIGVLARACSGGG